MATILDLPKMRARVRRWTVAEYERLGDDPAFKHYELIRGIIIDKMSKSPRHSLLAKKCYDYFLRSSCQGLTVRKEDPLHLTDSMPEPDVAVVRGTEDDYGLRHPTGAELVVEVAVSSVAPDRENASLYAEAGVTEYWIVLGETERVEVHRQPENGVYQIKRIYGRDEVIESVCVTDQPVPVESLFA